MDAQPLVGQQFSITCGVGRGTVVLSLTSSEDLHALEEVHTEAMSLLLRAAARRKMRVLGLWRSAVDSSKSSLINMIYHLHSLNRRIDSFEAAGS